MSDTLIETVGTVKVYSIDNALCWCAGLAVDADGSPHAYAPTGSGLRGLDYLANAGEPGNWYGLVCVKPNVPVVQGPNDPAPGYYVSATALFDRSKKISDPRRYVDSECVPYISISQLLMKQGAKKGDLAFVYCRATKMSSPALVADIGPRRKLGEGSIALAEALGVNSSPKNGGAGSGVVYVVFPNTLSDPAWPRDDVAAAAQQCLDQWGGIDKLVNMQI